MLETVHVALRVVDRLLPLLVRSFVRVYGAEMVSVSIMVGDVVLENVAIPVRVSLTGNDAVSVRDSVLLSVNVTVPAGLSVRVGALREEESVPEKDVESLQDGSLLKVSVAVADVLEDSVKDSPFVTVRVRVSLSSNVRVGEGSGETLNVLVMVF